MNSLISDTMLGTVQNVAEALTTLTTLLGQTKEGTGLYMLLLPLQDALEHEANK